MSELLRTTRLASRLTGTALTAVLVFLPLGATDASAQAPVPASASASAGHGVHDPSGTEEWNGTGAWCVSCVH
ncbi:hypothetical protein CFP65_1554 [Kitasatospora sp. MMS16-BH015]|uniref:hypothetical protein n=1 Tax=Kitasatospora sp. MMS16-BH015 TaxID=2018025 RepID=UPI000CA1B6F0|nr:hypothetical protein [Kitasatospora sp. MMS16-BH015]AUG76444.1 hypothetical protein CFP65_1554 [Kitasatospora sp. MMS16-BH015]